MQTIIGVGMAIKNILDYYLFIFAIKALKAIE